MVDCRNLYLRTSCPIDQGTSELFWFIEKRAMQADVSDLSSVERGREINELNRSAPQNNSFVCSLVVAAISDIECLERHHGAECGESALELISPLRSETEHLLLELRCSVEAPPPASHASKAGDSAEDLRNAEMVHSESNSTTISTLAATVSGGEFIRNESLDADAMIISPLLALGSLDVVCKQVSSTNDIYAPIRTKLCSRRPQFEVYADCYKQAAHFKECALKVRKFPL